LASATSCNALPVVASIKRIANLPNEEVWSFLQMDGIILLSEKDSSLAMTEPSERLCELKPLCRKAIHSQDSLRFLAENGGSDNLNVLAAWDERKDAPPPCVSDFARNRQARRKNARRDLSRLRLWFAKTLADFEINDIAALPPLFCDNS
jgi:hypothetical protein